MLHKIFLKYSLNVSIDIYIKYITKDYISTPLPTTITETVIISDRTTETLLLLMSLLATRKLSKWKARSRFPTHRQMLQLPMQQGVPATILESSSQFPLWTGPAIDLPQFASQWHVSGCASVHT